MKLYPKIDTLYHRDPETLKVLPDRMYRHPEFYLIDFGAWNITEKINGRNLSFRYHTGIDQVEVRGRTDRTEFKGPWVAPMRAMADRLHDGMAKIATAYKLSDFTIYGECYGPGIPQSEGYAKEISFIAFDMQAEDAWLDIWSVEDNAAELELPLVPEITFASVYDIDEFVQAGHSSAISGRKQMEGIVAKTDIPLFNSRGNRLMWKLKVSDFA